MRRTIGSTRIRESLAYALAVASLFLIGCDNSVEPLTSTPGASFAVHGFLDTAADTQFVRVEALRSTILGLAPDLEDVSVESLDRTDESIETWIRQRVLLEDGTTGHLFGGLFRPRAGHRIELRILRNDRTEARAVTDVPDEIVFDVQPPVGDTVQVSQTVILSGISRTPENVSLRYEVIEPESNQPKIIEIDHGRAGRPDPAGWAVEIFLKSDQLTVLSRLGRAFDDQTVGLRRLSMQVTMSSPAWSDPDHPVNLEGATGFFASVARLRHDWRIDPAVLESIGFRDAQ